MWRRALPNDFRFRDFLANDNDVRSMHLPARPFIEAMRERRPELFVEEDEVVFAQAPIAAGDNDAPVTAPTAAPVVLPTTGFVVDVAEDFTVDFGGIAGPPSHDFPI